MIRLAINQKRCVRCGECEGWLPGLLSHAPHGGLLISTRNEHVDAEAIQRAIDGCHRDALTLEAVGG